MRISVDVNTSTTAEKRDAFYQEVFYGLDENKSPIATEILRLYVQLPEQFKPIFPEYLKLIEQAKSYQKIPSSISLSDINKSLHNRKLISKHYITSFITSSITLSSYDVLKFEHYKALSLAVITQLYVHGDHLTQISNLCNEIRQYTQGRRKKLIPLLPDLNQYDFPTLISYFNDVIQQYEEVDKQQYQRLTYYRNPIRASFENRAGIHRKVSPKEFKQNSVLSISTPIPFDDSENEFKAELIEVSTQNSRKHTWHAEDNAQPDRSISLISSKRFVNRNRHMNAMQSRAINNAMTKNSMFLTCNINHILEFDIACVLQDCIKICQQDKIDPSAATALLLMLFTGNTFSEVTQWKSSRSEASDHIIGLKRRFHLPSVKKLGKQLQFLTKGLHTEYILPLPLNLVSHLRSFTFNSITQEDVKQLLSEIKSKYHLSLNLSSITQYMKQKLIADGVDICLIELINGHTPQNEPARFYTAINQTDYLRVYTKYCEHLCLLSESNFLNDRHLITDKGYLGSPFFIETIQLQYIFKQLKHYLNTIRPNTPSYFSELYHNMQLIELQMILGLTAGYRPVVDWFGTINDIHFPTGEYRIADKERCSSYSGRVIILPPIALQKLKHYLQYCEDAELHFDVQNPVLSQRYQDARRGFQAFCFFRDHGNIDAVTPSSYASQIDRILPFQPNWTRHYLRSYLHSQNISDELCAAWLGHQSSNQLPFSQFSQLNRSELIKISERLQVHLTSLLEGQYE